MKYLLLGLLFIIAGCQVDTIATSGVDKTNYDLIDYNTELKVKVEYGNLPDIHTFTSAWTRIQECSGLSAYTPPFIVVVEDIAGRPDALYFEDGVILIQSRSLRYSSLLRHEMLHHLLSANGMYKESNTHTSDLFDDCVPGTTIRNQ